MNCKNGCLSQGTGKTCLFEDSLNNLERVIKFYTNKEFIAGRNSVSKKELNINKLGCANVKLHVWLELHKGEHWWRTIIAGVKVKF